MDLNEHYQRTFIGDFEKQLPNIKQEIIKYMKLNQTSIYIEHTFNLSIALNSLSNRKNNPEFIPEFLSVDENGITLSMFTDELINFILDNIPENVQELTLPIEILRKNPTCLRRYQKLTKLGFSDYGLETTTDELKTYIEGTNINSINASEMDVQDIESILKNNYVIEDRCLTTKLEDVLLKCRSDEFGRHINLVPPITEEELSLIPKDFFSDGSLDASIRIDGKKIVEKKLGEINILLSDDVEFTKDMVIALFNRLEEKPKKVILVAQNKTYPNLESLKALESLCEVEIKYGYLDKASIDQFDAMRANLDYFKGLILQYDLSPAERICYAYDLIKSNVYRECQQNYLNARQIHAIVDTGYIVCLGYAKFLAQLLKEVGIKAHTIGTSVPLKDGTIAGHERNLIEIRDDKYGINGIYAFDCTWDSNSDFYKVIRDGEEKIVKEPKETDEIVRQFDAMSSYRYFFIPSDEYGIYFPGEKQFENISEWHGEEYNPTESSLEEISESSYDSKTQDTYTSIGEVDEDILMEIIYNTRMCEGYSPEINQQLLEEVKEIKRITTPKELRDKRRDKTI